MLRFDFVGKCRKLLHYRVKIPSPAFWRVGVGDFQEDIFKFRVILQGLVQTGFATSLNMDLIFDVFENCRSGKGFVYGYVHVCVCVLVYVYVFLWRIHLEFNFSASLPHLLTVTVTETLNVKQETFSCRQEVLDWYREWAIFYSGS